MGVELELEGMGVELELVGASILKQVRASVLISPSGHVAHACVPVLFLYVPVGHDAQTGRAVLLVLHASKHAQHDAHAPSWGQRDGYVW
jgi:hypothetical protein